MSCYAKHPDLPQIECWHSPDHAGDHNKEGRSWPNLKDPLRIEIARLTDEVERLRKDLEIAEQSRDAWMADRERIAGKNELLRAEVLALLEESCADAREDWPADSRMGRAFALVAKLRGAL